LRFLMGCSDIVGRCGGVERVKEGRSSFLRAWGGIHTINVPQPRSVAVDGGNRKKRDGDVCGEGEEVGE
jgi:hypothetical protein